MRCNKNHPRFGGWNVSVMAEPTGLESGPVSGHLVAALRAFALASWNLRSELDRATARRAAIERLSGLKVKSAARLVDAALRDAAPDPVANGMAGLALADPDPWPETVDGAALLEELRSTFKRFIWLPVHAAVALALWVLHAHAHDAFMISPVLCVRSPERGCGKTTLLDVLTEVLPRPLLVANATTAAIFRAIEEFQPVLLADECDAWLDNNEELRGILNAGHRRGGSVLRVVGDDHVPTRFSVWGPKALALIGDLPGTLEDRSVIVSLARASAEEFRQLERFRLDRHPQELHPMCRRVARWAADHLDDLRAADPDMPTTLYGRAADNWRPLLTVADVAGGDWPEPRPWHWPDAPHPNPGEYSFSRISPSCSPGLGPGDSRSSGCLHRTSSMSWQSSRIDRGQSLVEECRSRQCNSRISSNRSKSIRRRSGSRPVRSRVTARTSSPTHGFDTSLSRGTLLNAPEHRNKSMVTLLFGELNPEHVLPMFRIENSENVVVAAIVPLFRIKYPPQGRTMD